MGGSTTISTVQPMAGNLRVQTAIYGSVIPVVYGRTRISGNLIWYGGFKAIPHTTTKSQGGKGGGGVTQSNTEYTYTAAILMSLVEGVTNTVVSAWKGKQSYGAALTQGVPNVQRKTVTVPGGGVVNVGDANFMNNSAVTGPRGYDYNL